MKFNLEQIGCSKCHKALPLQRHHMGCEHMWLDHFRKWVETERYQTFRERYYSFEEKDIVRLCRPCHKKIHRHYLAIIRNKVAEAGYKKLQLWTWDEAEKLMALLRASCRKWIAAK